MRKYAAAAVATTLTAVPILWAIYFCITYRCDLERYAHLWTHGTTPAWLTGWELAVTVAGFVIALILAPKIAQLWARAKPLTRGEWISMWIVAVLVVVAIRIAPGAMMDLSARFDALLGDKSGVCPH